MGFFNSKPRQKGIIVAPETPVKAISEPAKPEAQLAAVAEEVPEYEETTEEKPSTEALDERKEEEMNSDMGEEIEEETSKTPVTISQEELMQFAQEMDLRLQKIESVLFRRLG